MTNEDVPTSRLIVKNLPKRCTEKELREKFSSHGHITDCQLKYTTDGVFRQFAFVGFESETSANDARKYYDRTYMGSNRLAVDTCRAIGDEHKPRGWSKYATDSSAHARGRVVQPPREVKPEKWSTAKVDHDTQRLANDRGFKELAAIRGQSKLVDRMKSKSTPADDDECSSESESDDVKDVARRQLRKALMDGDPSFSVIIYGLPGKVKTQSINEFLAPQKPKRMKIERAHGQAAALITFVKKLTAQRVLAMNDDMFGGFKIAVVVPPASTKVEPAARPSTATTTAHPPVDLQEQAAKILDTGRLFLRNLAYTITESVIRKAFEQFGPVNDIKLPVDRADKPKGYAMITYMFPEHALEAFSKLDGQIFYGRNLHIVAGDESRDNTEAPASATETGTSSFKAQKAKKNKNTAVSGHNWNALFLGQNAVADMMAKQLETDKSAILDAHGSSSLAVRMALGETNIVRSTRTFLLKNGVCLDAFSNASAERSKTVIVVKNLPADTDVLMLRNVFAKFGDVGRVVLPPDGGITALVEFARSVDASRAFKTLAYSRFISVPLYLEWAPGMCSKSTIFIRSTGSVFDAATIRENEEQLATEAAHVADKKEKKDEESGGDSDDGETKTDTSSAPATTAAPSAEGSTIFVKNVSFDTSDEQLTAKFANVGDLVDARIAVKPDPKRRGEMLSMGYAFVTFVDKRAAEHAIKNMQGSLLNGHCLELKMSNRTVGTASTNERTNNSSKQGESSKILVRNVPFQANQTEIESLFSSFGELSSVRLPIKVKSGRGEGAHRGFAFVQFASIESARRAFDALVHSTHLYGRRLVLEWASDASDSLDVARSKNAAAIAGRSSKSNAKRHMNEALDSLQTKRGKVDDDDDE